MSITKSKANVSSMKQKIPFSIVFHNSKHTKICQSQYFMKLNFFGKGITHIDKMISGKQSLNNIIQLDLSHNSISLLENIKQFKGLVFINLTHNFITDCQQILNLQYLPKIRTVLVKGNPFLQKKISCQVSDFFLTQQNDIDSLIFNQIPKSSFDSLVQKMCKKHCLLNYLNKITLHTQLVNEYNMETYTPIVPMQKIGYLFEVFSQFTGNFDLIYQTARKVIQLKNKNKLSIKQSIQTLERQEKIYLEKIEQQIKQRVNVLNHLKVTALQKQKQVQVKSRLGSQENRYKQQQGQCANQAKEVKLHLSALSLRNKAKDYFGRQIQGLAGKTERKLNIGQQPQAKQTQSNSLSKTQKFDLSTIRNQNTNSKSIGKSKVIDQNQQELQTQKANPIYHLLYSPLNSLKPREKDLLIQALSKDLKQKNILQRKYQGLKAEFKMFRQQENQQKQILVQNICQLQQKYKCSVEQNQKITQAMKQLISQNKYLQSQVASKQQMMQIEKQAYNCIQQQLQANRKQTMNLKNCFQYYTDLQDKQQMLKISHQKKIKEQYFGLFNIKASKHLKLKNLKQHNATQLDKKLLGQSFFSWKIYFNKMKELFKFRQKTQQYCAKQALRSLSIYKQLSLDIKNLRTSIIKARGSQFLQMLRNLFKNTRKIQLKLNLHSTKRQKSIKTNIFRSLLELKQLKINQQNIKVAIAHHQYSLFKKSFKSILIFNKQVAHKEIQVFIYKNLKLKHQFMDLLVLKKSLNKVLAAKYIQLRLFVESKRIYQSFSHIWYSFQQEKQQNIQKMIYLQKLREKQVFNFMHYFTQVERQTRVVTHLKTNQIKNLIKKNTIYRIFQNKAIKKNSSKNFKKLLCSLSNKKRTKQIQIQAQQFLVQRIVNKARVKEFLHKLRQSRRIKLQIDHKKLILCFRLYQSEAPVLLLQKKQFFKNIKCRGILQKKLRIHFMKKLYSRMFNCFNDWKIVTYKQKIMFLSDKLQELGPQVCEISARQKQLNQQKLALLREIESKEQTIAIFAKKLEDRQFLIRTKDIKYQKLKSLYTDVLEQRIYKEKQQQFRAYEQLEQSKNHLSHQSKSISNFKYSSIRNTFDKFESVAQSNQKKAEKDFDDSREIFPSFRRF